jgi:transcriptional regulator with XRE-family HTH domain
MQSARGAQSVRTQTGGRAVLSALVAATLRSLRVAAHLTQAEVASAVGVTVSQVSRWEMPDDSVPLLRHQRRLAEIYGVSVEALGLG